jgi:flagella basal body P-ring formation protein FlgA
VKASKTAFFAKKEAKKRLFAGGGGDVVAKARNEQKFFASFFQKRSSCLGQTYFSFVATGRCARNDAGALGAWGLMVAGGICALPVPAFAQESPAAVEAAIHQALAPILPQGAAVTLGSADGAHVMPSCGVPLSVTMSGAQPYENAAVSCSAPVWTLYVPVTVAATEAVVVAVRPIAAGQAIGPGDVDLRPEPDSDFQGQPVFYDPAAIAGGVATLNLPAGAILTGNDIQAPVLVKAGQTVSVDVRSGGVDLTVSAVAAEAGRVGDTILLTNPSSGRRFTAVLTAGGPVIQLQQ